MYSNRYRFPRYAMDNSLQLTPSHWPLSHIRSSVGERDVSPESETFDRYWLDDRMVFIPPQEQTLKNLTGRSIQESLAPLDTNFVRDYPGPPPDAPSHVRQCTKKATEAYPHYVYGEHYYPLAGTAKVDSEMECGGTQKSKSMQESISRTLEVGEELSSMVLDERGTIHQRSISASTGDRIVDKSLKNANLLMDGERPKTEVTGHAPIEIRGIHPPTSTPPKKIPPERSSLPPHPSMSICNILNHDIWEIAEPPNVPQPISPRLTSENKDHHPSKENLRRLPQRHSAPMAFDVEQSEEDDDPTDSFHETPTSSSVNPVAKSKAKQKLGEQGSHVCKICNVTFTRNFDLQRHNQRHKEETDEDKARRTCTNCHRLLSRVDATKRHVDTLPDSCNHVRKKEGKGILPPMPQSHYEECKAKYYKLAQETKKPRGRKKAVAFQFIDALHSPIT